MKLYYSAGSCSTSCHITLEESGLKYEAIGVDWDDPKDPNIEVVTKLNKLGTLPILVTDDGRQLDQNLAIHTYVAELAPGKNLLPPAGTFERAEVMNALTFVATDLHKGIGAFFGLPYISKDKNVLDEVRKSFLKTANGYLKYMDEHLENRDYFAGKTFTVADAYAFVVTGWCQWLEIPLTPYKNVQKFMERVGKRPAVAKVLKEEGLT